jgi:putative component of membrane protein insertase Oxa1/YidC/SpoIIIJ protein YidD
MRQILLLSIRVYQKFWPNKLKGKGCVFSESCSNHVFRITKRKGFTSGVKALRTRVRDCRPGYYIVKMEDEVILITRKGSIYQEEKINPTLLK